jgi:hypothetical protein
MIYFMSPLTKTRSPTKPRYIRRGITAKMNNKCNMTVSGESIY